MKNLTLAGHRIMVNNQNSPWYSYTGTVIHQDADGSFLVEFSAGRQRYISGMDFCLIAGNGRYASGIDGCRKALA